MINLDLVQMAISATIPAIVALLNDPRPNRAWLRVLIVVAVVAGAAVLHILQAQTPLTLKTFGAEMLTLMMGSQLVHRLLKIPFEKLEEGSGNGIGVLIDGIVRGNNKDDNSPEAKLNKLESLKVRGFINDAEYNKKRSEILEEIL
jgi:hypothetical protein